MGNPGRMTVARREFGRQQDFGPFDGPFGAVHKATSSETGTQTASDMGMPTPLADSGLRSVVVYETEGHWFESNRAHSSSPLGEAGFHI